MIRCGTSMAFSVFDSYVEPNLSNLITNKSKISFIRRKWTVVITVRRADSCKMHLLIRERNVNATKGGVG